MRDNLVGEGRLFQPDIMLPAQYFSVLRKTAPQGPEYGLVLAMLQDAIECFQKYRFATDENGRALYADARDWITSTDRKWPFSFENICGILKFDVDYVRSGLARWGEREDELRRRGKVLPFKAPTPFVEPVAAPAAAKAS
ncbi:MAG TPA: hypothetical protein VGC36_05740 [Rhizomicrobium sp.]